MENKHFVKDENLEIRIKFDKNVTTAALIKDGKTTIKIANAICSKQDVFDEERGAILAVQRLFGEKKWINLSKLILPNVSFPYKFPHKDETLKLKWTYDQTIFTCTPKMFDSIPKTLSSSMEDKE